MYLGITQTELVSSQIAEQSTENTAQVDFITQVVAEFEVSPSRLFMDTAWKYYKNENDILGAKRTVIGRDGENNAVLMESNVLSNNKLTHNFMKKLTRQKIGYMIGKPFTLTAVQKDDKKAEEFFTKCKKYFGKDFFKMIKNIGRDSIVKGISWLFVYYNESGQLRFLRCNPEEIIPLWADSDHTELDAVIRKYTVEQYKNGKKIYLKFVEYYTHEGVYYYKYNTDGKLVIDTEKVSPSPYFRVTPATATSPDDAVGVNWAKIPFIPFKYDPDEQSLLTRIKSLIDDYDKKTSSVANNIDDFPNSITVVKNYDGASKEEFVHNKNNYRTIFVQGDGDARALETPLNVGDIDKHLQRLQTDIYEFGQGVNTADKDIRDTSGVALRFIYADLDMDCIDWGNEFEWSIMLLLWFIQQDLIAKGEGDYTEVEYKIVFNTDVIINETETITNCLTSNGLISRKTVAANHPWVINAETEVKDILSDEEDTLDLEDQYGSEAPTASKGQQGV